MLTSTRLQDEEDPICRTVRRLRLPVICWICLGALTPQAFAQHRATATVIDFERDIRPIFNQHCVACHGGVKQAGELSFVYLDRLVSKADANEGVIVPGKPEISRLIERITSPDPEIRMPPVERNREGLAPSQIEILRNWVLQGAHWRPHWAYVAPEPQALPAIKRANWPRQRMDYFVLAKLEQEQIEPAGTELPTRWLRRVSLDLTGLPPSLEQREKFLLMHSQNPDAACASAVDECLNSSRFGEHWASRWLDVVRYADSKGLGKDERRLNWRYRDWVIEALNTDLPYDQFTIQQIAGDLLPDPQVTDLMATGVHRLTQTNGEGGTDDEEFRVSAVLDRVNTTWQAWQGVTFGCAQCHDHPYDPIRHEEYYRFLAFFNNTSDSDTDQEFPLMRAPLAQRDYRAASELQQEVRRLGEEIWRSEYARLMDETLWKPMTGVQVTSQPASEVTLERREGWEEFVTPADVPRNTVLTIEASSPGGLEQLTAIQFTGLPRDLQQAARDTEWGFILTGFTAELLAPEQDSIPLKFARVIIDEPEPFFDPQNTILEQAGEESPRRRDRGYGFSAYSRIDRPRRAAFILESPVKLTTGMAIRVKLTHGAYYLDSFPLVTARGRLAFSGDESFTRLLDDPELCLQRDQLKEVEKQLAAIPSVDLPILRELPPHLKRPTFLYQRGAYLSKGKEVVAGVPASFPPLDPDATVDRLALARWLVDAKNPLTARVAVNRIWGSLMEVPLVVTEEDFGSSGMPPSHPQLLDDLAFRFRTELGWSMKRLIREITLSSAYRQSSRIRPELLDRDRENRWLARGPRSRLSAELVRDQALAISGLLSGKLHGPPVHPPLPEGVWMPFDASDKWETPPRGAEDRYRRSIYTYYKRTIPYPTFAAFDAPSREFCAPRRLPSNTPLQALMTLNDEAFVECAQALGKKIALSSTDPVERLHHGFLLATQREPDAAELEQLQKLIGHYGPDRTDEAYTMLAALLLNLDEVLTR